MKYIIAFLITILIQPGTVYSQIKSIALVDSVLNNQISISRFKERIENNSYTHHIRTKGSSSENFITECNSDSEIIVQVGDSLYQYNFELDTTKFITKIIHGISVSFGYIGGFENKIVTAANWDSVYYYDGSWDYSGYLGHSNSDLISTACGNKTTYFMGGHLWYFNGNSNPKLIRSNISYSVADLAVDERENAWVLTGKEWPVSDTLRIIDSTGTSLCDIPFIEPVNTFNGYGMLIRNGKAVIGFGPSNPIYPNSLVPLEISSSGDFVSFGEPLFQSKEFTLDLAGCSKKILLPNCTLTNLDGLIDPETIVTVYPNPSNNRLFVISGNQKVNTIKIADVYGKNYPVNIDKSKSYYEIDLSNFPNGMYTIYVELNGERMHIKKIIKR